MMSTGGRTKTLPPVRPNAGIEAIYRRRIENLIDEMEVSTTHWVLNAYRRDASLADIQKTLRGLRRKYKRKFGELAPRLASYFTASTRSYTDNLLKKQLRRVGFRPRFKNTAAMNETLRACVLENTRLIRSIGNDHMDQIEGVVLRAFQTNQSVINLSDDLKDRYAITRRRAYTIAADQTNTVTSATTRIRRMDLGLLEAVWVHTGAARHPRPSHVAAGRSHMRFKIDDGALIDGEYIHPGQKPGCNCVSMPIIPGYGQ
jgi:uncharacterized protein with gpF-like domain